MVKKAGLLLLTIVVWASLAAQARVSISTSVNKQTLYQSDMLIYNLRISLPGSQQPETPDPPRADGLRFHNQSSSRESRASIINGRLETTSSVTYSFHYYPTRSGKITIPAQNVRVGKSSYKTDPVTVEVKPDLAPPSRPAPTRPGSQAPAYDPFAAFYPDPTAPQGESYILCLPETQSVYRSEPAIVSYYLYTTEDVRSLNLTEERDFDGYGKAVYEQPNNLNFERVTYQGRGFRRSLLKRLVLYPHRTGELRAPEMAGSIRLMTFMYQNRGLRSKPATITVRDLPPGAPSGYGGAIGSFNLTEKLSSGSVKLGEAIIYTVQISGQGNFSQFTAPLIPSDARVQISSPQVRDQLNAGTKGVRILQYTVVPRVKGDIRLPVFKFVWLDSASGKYLLFTGQEAVLNVKPGSNSASAPELSTMLDRMTMLPRIERDIYPTHRSWYSRWWYWLTVLTLLGSLPVSALRARQRKLHLLDPVAWRDKTAAARLHSSVSEARTAAEKSRGEFCRIAAHAVSAYLKDKYELPGHLSSVDLNSALRDKGMESVLLDQLMSFLEDAQAAQFAPRGSQDVSPEADLKRFKMLVDDLARSGGKK